MNKEDKMTELNTETTQDQAGNTVTQNSPAVTEQGTVGATTPAPSKTNVEQTTQIITEVPVTTQPATQPPKLTPEEVQKRVDRMYARLQEERKRRLVAETRLNLGTPTTATDEYAEGVTEEETTARPLTEADVETILDRKDLSQQIISSETHVFERHPNALNEDGSFNMSDPFVQKYIEVGRMNPALGSMPNGPELAEALVDKMLGVDYKKGRKDEATRNTQTENSFTTTSTTAIPPISGTSSLSKIEQRIARHMHMTDQEYINNKASNKVNQKSWEVKAR